MTSPRERVLTALKRNGTPDRTPFEISWGAFTPLLMKTYREKTGSELPPEEYFDFDTRSVFPGPTRLRTDFTRFFPDGVEPEASFDEWGIGFYEYKPQMNQSRAAVRDRFSYIGSFNPDITGGFNNRFFFKGFDLAVSCNFVFGQLVSRTPFYSPTQTSPGQNYTTEMNKVWSPENVSGIYPALTGGLQADATAWGDWDDNPDPYRVYNWILEQSNQWSSSSIFNTLDIWYKKINYFRVNSIRLGYAFPEKITRKLHMAGLRVHFEARNPFVIASNYDGYFDPESYGSIYSQPMARTYSVGLNITF